MNLKQELAASYVIGYSYFAEITAVDWNGEKGKFYNKSLTFKNKLDRQTIKDNLNLFVYDDSIGIQKIVGATVFQKRLDLCNGEIVNSYDEAKQFRFNEADCKGLI